MEHLDDCDLNDPIPGITSSPLTAPSVTVDTGALATLLEMGIMEDLVSYIPLHFLYAESSVTFLVISTW